MTVIPNVKNKVVIAPMSLGVQVPLYIPWAVSTSELNTSGEPSVLTSLAYQTPLLGEPLSPKGLAAYFQDGFRA